MLALQGGTSSGVGRHHVRAGLATAVLVALLVSGCSTGAPGAAGPTPDPATAPPVLSPTPSIPPSADPADQPRDDAPTPRGPERPTPTASPSPQPTTAPTPPVAPPAPAPVPEPAPTVPPEPSEPSALRRGDEGPEVLALQERLAALGYFITAPDGRFGASTQQAVWALQKAAGLARDGLVGPATQAALDAGTRPAPRTTTGRAIEVDLDRQLLLAVDDGVVTRVVNASSGNGERYVALGRSHVAYTPTGDYTVVRQIDAVHESSLELGSMYRPKYFRSGWAVHGSASIPPWPASHGCVRVSDAAMDWIWDTWGAPIGTRVVVY